MKFKLIFAAEVLVILALCIIIAIFVTHYPRQARAQSTVLGPYGTSVALSTTSAQIIGTNPTRRGLQICNISASIIEYIAPSPLVPVTGGTIGISLPAVASGVQSCFTAPSGLSIGQAWNGVSASATPNVTVLEYP